MRAFLRRSLTGIALCLTLALSGQAAVAQETRLSMDEARDLERIAFNRFYSLRP